LRGSKREIGRAARDQVLLARQIGYPQAVDHIVGDELDPYRPADRQMQLVRGDEVCWPASPSLIFDLPPPLLRGHA
jgi:hypothetical protein